MKNRFEQYKITPALLPAGISSDGSHDPSAPVSDGEIEEALAPLIPRDCGHSLVRIGGPGDGGYLLPDDFEGIEACFSPGVNNFKNFEDQLAGSYGIKSFMCDFTSDPDKLRTPLIDGLQTFEKKWLDVEAGPDNLDINGWVAENTSPTGDCILQIDIEGAEYRNLLHASEDTLARFRMIVIELHGLYLLRDSAFMRGIFRPVMQKLAKQFVCCHAHGNNCCGTAHYTDEWSVPNVLELTFLRRDRVRAEALKLSIPHPKDDINVSWNPPVRLAGAWLRNADPGVSELMHLRQSAEWMQHQIVESLKTQKKLQVQLNACGTRIQSQLRKRFGKFENVALGKQASQSSLSKHSTSEGAAGAINGRKTGRFGFHTMPENKPWWTVDLGEIHELRGIVIYNRMDAFPERADKLKVKISQDGTEWTRIYNHAGRPTFGGAMGDGCGFPLLVNPKMKQARHVRIECAGRTCLHLDEIEIYGCLPNARPAAGGGAKKHAARKAGKSI